MNLKQAQEYLGNANATKFAIDFGVVSNWNDVASEISSLDHGDHGWRIARQNVGLLQWRIQDYLGVILMTKEQLKMLEQVRQTSMATHADESRVEDDVRSVESAFISLRQIMTSNANQTDKDNDVMQILADLFANVQ